MVALTNPATGAHLSVLTKFIDTVTDAPPKNSAEERFQGIVRLMVKIASKHVRSGRMTAEDAIDVITYTFARWDSSFDPSRGFRYTTYMGKCLELQMRDPRHRHSAVHIPVSAWPELFRCINAQADLRQETGMHPSAQEIAERTGIGYDRVLELLAVSPAALKNRGFCRITTPAGDESVTIGMSNIPVGGGMDPAFRDRALQSGDDPQASTRLPSMDEMVAVLKPRERIVVLAYYRDGMNLREIGEAMGFTRERARQIKDEALNRMRGSVTVTYEEVFA